MVMKSSTLLQTFILHARAASPRYWAHWIIKMYELVRYVN
jgi:hypothetical protein